MHIAIIQKCISNERKVHNNLDSKWSRRIGCCLMGKPCAVANRPKAGNTCSAATAWLFLFEEVVGSNKWNKI